MGRVRKEIPDIIQYIHNRSSHITETGCLLWGGACNKDGYGYLRVGGNFVRVHRAMYSAINGPLPPGMSVCHSCDVPCCVNPNHLFLGTPLDNMRDKIKKNRANNPTGDKHKSTIVLDKDVHLMRLLAALSIHTQEQLAKIFKTSRANVSLITRYKSRK